MDAPGFSQVGIQVWVYYESTGDLPHNHQDMASYGDGSVSCRADPCMFPGVR